MNNLQFFRENCPDDIPFFSSPLWLDFICPDCWDIALITENNKIIALMPFMVNDIKNPTKIIMPPFTKFLGPYLKIEKDKPSSYVTKEIRLLKELEKQLPPVKYFRQTWHPQYLNCLPFLWKEYQAKIKYCYIIKKNQTKQLAWEALNEDTRRLVRKAGKNNISIHRKNDPAGFFKIVNKVFKHQNLSTPYEEAFLEKMGKFIELHNCGDFIFAVDRTNNYMACGLVFFDKDTKYLFAGGADPQQRNTGANALLIWSLIEEAISNNRAFNFLGSTIKYKESFIRSFGGQLLPYLDVIRNNRLFARLKRGLKRI